MKIFYIANIALPTERAHGIQITKTCEALSKDIEVELVVTSRFTPIRQNPFEYYNLKNNFKITKLWCLDTVHLGWLGFWLELLTFTLSLTPYVIFKKGIFLLFKNPNII